MSNKRNILQIAIAVFLMAGTSASFAQNEASDQPMKKAGAAQMSPELKKEMAEMYQKMSDCLKTDKSMEQCQKEIVKDCPVAAKTGHCPLKEGMRSMMKKGMNHSKSMNQE